MKNSILIITMLPILIACGNNNTNLSDDPENSKIEVSSANEMEISPCDLISETDIKNLFSIPENTPAEVKDVVRTYPTCFYKWETVKFSETKKIGNNEVSIDYPTEVTIVLVKNADEKKYNTSIKVYKDGQTQNGIGDMAIWGGKMSQLTFLSQGYMIHVYVKMSSDQSKNKEMANKIAALIIKKL